MQCTRMGGGRSAWAIVLAAGCNGGGPAHGGPAPALLRLPPGFQVGVFADDLDGVRYLTLGPGNAVYASRPAAGDILKLPDTDRDGVADSVITVARDLAAPFGIAFRGDTMYVAEERAVRRFDPGAAAPVAIVPRLPGGSGHSTRTIVFGADGRLYVSVGSSCNLCDEIDSMRATVLQFRRDGSGGRVFARGLRNSVGLAVHPTTGELWATNNDRDNLGEDLPPERINIVTDGRDYGWPRCYLPGEPNPEYDGADCSTVEPPAITFQAHSAPLGIAFHGDTAAFVAFHGSWNRSVPTGAKVVRVAVQDGRPVAVDDFIVGWQRPDGSRWGRPVGLVVTADGALLVSDDMGGTIWRITYER